MSITKQSCHNIKNAKEIIEEKQKEENQEKEKQEKQEHQIIETLKKVVDAKDTKIKQKDGKISELLPEKEAMAEQYDRIKRGAKNMDEEIKMLRLKLN